MVQININKEQCILCAKCVKVCPSAIFSLNSSARVVEVQHVENCIKCGHCAAVCGDLAIEHSLFSTEKIHAYDRSTLPDPEQLLRLIQARRSMRVYSKKPVPDHMLEMIVRAAHCAPTATNTMNISFTLITNSEKLHAVSSFTIDTFDSIVRKIDNPFVRPLIRTFAPSVMRYLPIFKKMKREFNEGCDRVLRGATALLLIHAPKDSRFGPEDANLAYQNGSLMAESLGVGQFYSGFVLNATRMRKGALEKELGIDGRIFAGMALGMPAISYPNYVDRSEVNCSRI